MQPTLKTSRRGMALPMVLILLFVLVGALAASFTLARGERRLNDAAVQTVSAQSLAESGLNLVLQSPGNVPGISSPPGAADSGRVLLTGGYADVIVTRIRAASGTTIPALYLVRTRGVATIDVTPDTVNATAVMTSFATWARGNITVQAAVTGINGINKSGGAGVITGFDGCGSGTNVAGVAVPTTGSDGGPGYDQSGGGPVPTGSPAQQTIGANPAAAAAAVPINWNAIVNNNAITPTFRVPPDAFPNAGWFTSNPTAYPIIYIDNTPGSGADYALPNDGRGTLIVEEDVTINGSTRFDGVMLVGGRIRSNGNNTNRGAFISGLNVKLGLTPAPNDMNDFNGNKDFEYNSCQVANAMTGFGSMRVYRNTWSNGAANY